MNGQTTTIEKAPSWAWWILLAIVGAILLIGFWHKKPERRETTTIALARSCETWERQYAVIPWNEFPRDRRLGRALRVGRGEEWLIRLSPTDTSGWIIFDPTARDNWTLPTGTAHMLFSDGLKVTDAPGKRIERGRRNSFRSWGEGCLLVRVSG